MAGDGLHMLLGALAGGACYYLATQLAWTLTLPDSKVSLFFPPHAILVSILLLAPYRRWWAYVLAALAAHFLATQQAGWPLGFALQAEAYDGVTAMLGIPVASLGRRIHRLRYHESDAVTPPMARMLRVASRGCQGLNACRPAAPAA